MSKRTPVKKHSSISLLLFNLFVFSKGRYQTLQDIPGQPWIRYLQNIAERHSLNHPPPFLMPLKFSMFCHQIFKVKLDYSGSKLTLFISRAKRQKTKIKNLAASKCTRSKSTALSLIRLVNFTFCLFYRFKRGIQGMG